MKRLCEDDFDTGGEAQVCYVPFVYSVTDDPSLLISCDSRAAADVFDETL